MQMLPEAWEEALGFMCSSTSCWERLFAGMVWCKSIFLIFSLDFTIYAVTVGRSCRAALTVLLIDEQVLFLTYCARANCSCLSVTHSGFSIHWEKISNALMAFQSGHIYLLMNCKHLNIACNTSFKTLLSVCCVVQFRGTCKCCIGQLLLWWYVSPTKVPEVLGEFCSWSRAQALCGWKRSNLAAQNALCKD